MEENQYFGRNGLRKGLMKPLSINMETNEITVHIAESWKVYDFININEIIYFNYNLILFSLILDKYSPILGGNIFNLTELFNTSDKVLKDEINENIFKFTGVPSSVNLHNILRYLPDEYQIRIKSLKYSSPGSMDFLGIGEIIKQLKELLNSLCTLDLDRARKKAEITEKEEQIKAQRIKNIDSTLNILEKYNNIPPELIRELKEQNRIDSIVVKELSTLKKITKIEIK